MIPTSGSPIVSSPTDRLKAELGMSVPFRSPAHAAVLSLLRTADSVRRAHQQLVEKEEISLEQYNVLRILRGAKPNGLPTLEIASRLVEKSPGITRLLDRLEEKGFITRQRLTKDRRVVLGHILPLGEECLSRLDDPMDQASFACVDGLTAEELVQLTALLDRVRRYSADSCSNACPASLENETCPAGALSDGNPSAHIIPSAGKPFA